MNPAVDMKACNVVVVLRGQKIIDGLSLELYRREILAIIGPNGSGKTVFLKALLHLLPYQGTIEWRAGLRLGYVPQKITADRQLPLLARDLLDAKARCLRLRQRDIDEAIQFSGLTPGMLNTGIAAISGGQFQKLLIAMALLGRPDVLLCDEPTASLDELEEERVYEQLEELRSNQGLTIMMVTHDLSLVHSVADRVLCLSKGGACVGTPASILTPKVLGSAYGGSIRYFRHHR